MWAWIWRCSRPTRDARGRKPYVLAQMRHGQGVGAVVSFLEHEGGLRLA